MKITRRNARNDEFCRENIAAIKSGQQRIEDTDIDTVFAIRWPADDDAADAVCDRAYELLAEWMAE
ncbi:MAG: hypothetical protein ACYSW8_31175 [Planctomycetota bacterium]|jgi:hypothetical protein